MRIVEEAINESIAKNKVYTIEEADCRDYKCSVNAVCDALFAECDDYTPADTNAGVGEYWGRDVDGNDWRVHVTTDPRGRFDDRG